MPVSAASPHGASSDSARVTRQLSAYSWYRRSYENGAVRIAPARVWIVLTVLRFTVGYVLEEQAARPDADALDGFDMAAYAAAYPTVMAGVTEYFQPGRTVDDLFRDCLDQIIHGPAAQSGPTS